MTPELPPYGVESPNARAANTITVEFDAPAGLSMLRVWNYNKGRIHSYRGVRRLQAWLDGRPIFDGEVRKAPGAIDEGGELGAGGAVSDPGKERACRRSPHFRRDRPGNWRRTL